MEGAYASMVYDLFICRPRCREKFIDLCFAHRLCVDAWKMCVGRMDDVRVGVWMMCV